MGGDVMKDDGLWVYERCGGVLNGPSLGEDKGFHRDTASMDPRAQQRRVNTLWLVKNITQSQPQGQASSEISGVDGEKIRGDETGRWRFKNWKAMTEKEMRRWWK